MLKYLIVPGYVISQTDGDRHFISASQLMRLYGVRPDECLVFDYYAMEFRKARIMEQAAALSLIELQPRYDGNYTLPTWKERTMQPHQQRVIDEKADLDRRATALSNFIGLSPIFLTLDQDEQERMKVQNDLMWQLSEVLGARIAAFNN